MKQFFIATLAVMVLGCVGIRNVDAHKQIRDALQERYKAEKLKVKSCNFCHIKGEKKNAAKLTEFAKLIAEHKLFKGEGWSVKIKEAKEAEKEEEEDKLLEEMVEAFKKAMDDIEKISPKKDGPTYGELIKKKELEYLVTDDDDE